MRDAAYDICHAAGGIVFFAVSEVSVFCLLALCAMLPLRAQDAARAAV